MREKFFIVTDRFEIQGRGTAIVGERPTNLPDFKIGSPIVLISPENKEMMTKVSGIDLPTTISGRRLIGVLIENIAKRDIPIGTEVFLQN
jgi:hypothetical protein